MDKALLLIKPTILCNQVATSPISTPTSRKNELLSPVPTPHFSAEKVLKAPAIDFTTRRTFCASK